MLADQVVRALPIEDDDRVVIPQQARHHDGAGRDAVGAVQPKDFLHEVDRAVEIAPPARDGHGPPGLALDRELVARDGQLQRLERLLHRLIRHLEPELPPHEIGGERDLALPRAVFAHLVDRADDLAAGGIENEIHRPVRVLPQGVRVDPALVPVGTVGGEAELARGPTDPGRLEIGHFEDEVGRRLVDLGPGAAHDPGHHQRLVGVGDHEHAGVEQPLLPVEGHEFLALVGAADHQPPAADFFRIESVNRLAGLEHHEIAHVDHVVDRAQPNRLQALLQPGRTGADLHAGDQVGGVERAVLARFHRHVREQVAALRRLRRQSRKTHRRVN